MYKKGLQANIELLPEIYPDWIIRIYSDSEKLFLDEFEKQGCEIIIKPLSNIHSGMFWRFLAAWDDEAERVIFRDCDSRFNVKEAEAVKAWEKSDLDAHCMHDHPHHESIPIFGGMWGIKCGVLPRDLLQDTLKQCRLPQKRIQDMYWLRDKVHPIIKNSLLRHSSVRTKWAYVPFPTHSEYDGFVGQQYNEKGNPICPDI